MGTDHQEVEWQFDTRSLAAVEQWLRTRSAAGDLHFQFGVPEEQRDSYYDTPDWRFFTAGYALRLRQASARNEVTLKSFGTEADGLRRRRELNQPLPASDGVRHSGRALERLDGDVGARVRAVVGKAHLTRLFEIRTQRNPIAIRNADAQLAEIVLDDVVIVAGRRSSRLQRVEVEARAADGAAGATLSEFIDEFRATCALVPATHSKFEIGLRAHALQPGAPVNFGQPAAAEHAGDDPSMGDLAFAVMREHFAVFLSREPGSRLGEDIEDVHRMRVATRRLRAAMSLFRDYLPEVAPSLRNELRWVGRALGGVRDLDVQLERIREWHADGMSLYPDALRGLESLLRDERERARAHLLQTLDQERYERFVADYSAMLRAGPGSSPAATRRARSEMPNLIQKRYVKVRAAGDAIDDDSPAEALHELRIRCKRLRYALEFSTGLYPKAVRNYLSRLIELLDLLGSHQDAHVAIQQMRGLGLTHQRELPPQTLFTLGEIAQLYVQQATDLRAQFPKLYRRIKGKPWQQLQRALDDA
jgi:CHAD domain-containing protein